MLTSLWADMQLYRRLIGMQLRAQFQYKANLVVDIATVLLVTALEFVGILIYFGTFPSLLGWQVGEVILLHSLAATGFGLAEMIGAGIDGFADTIRLGEFDRVLLRPVGTFMQVIGSDFRLRRLGRITEGCIAFCIALRLLPGLHWSVDKVLVLLLGVTTGTVVFIALFLLGATLCFWTVEAIELINILTDGGREMLGYPLSIYHQLLQRVFLFVVPLAFGSFVPACYILDRALPFGLPREIAFITPCIALLFAFVAGIVWNIGVRHYQSTGS